MDIRELLWNNTGTSDKVWGYFVGEEGQITFWGRRGAHLSFKHDSRDLWDIAYDKRRKGYDKQNVEQFQTMCEQQDIDFLGLLRRQYIKAKLAGNFHREDAPTPVDIGAF